MAKSHYDIVIVGAGTAGLSIAARLVAAAKPMSIAIVEPSQKHYYQPIWTLVGAGIFPREISERNQADYVPRGVDWIQSRVVDFQPEKNEIKIDDSREPIHYNELIVTLGIQINWKDIKGLQDTLGKNGVSSNYSYDFVSKTWSMIDSFTGGTALFSFPATPIKCAGAPQKIMYLAEEHFRRKSMRTQSTIKYMSATASMFGIPRYREALERIVENRGIEASFRENLVEVRSKSREAIFRHLDKQTESVVRYDFMHVTPPQGPPDVIKNSPLSDDTGWVDVDKHTLQHNKYSNIWSSGDCSSLPVSKTGAAIRKQVPVLVDNLLAKQQGLPLTAKYDGYASCPLVTGRGKAILAEFGYDGQIMETFPFDQSQERYSMYALKAYALPSMYWHGMLKGRV